MIGQDAVATAQAFLDGVGYDGVVLTKLDGDARGGAALSIAELTGRPVMFASSGEKLEDFDVFHPDRMASRILDMGDMLTLIEQAERTFDEDQAASMANKLASGEGFTLEDFVEQLAMVRKLGPIGNLLGMLPGAAQNREMLSQISDKDLDRAAAIVSSMTPAERRNPKILNGSRRSRIANGSGVTVGEVNNLVVRFLEGQKMMRQMMGGGGMPGMPAIPGMRRATAKSAKGKKNNKKKPKGGRPGGNPAKAAQPKAAGAPRAGNGAAPALPPGLGGGGGGGALGGMPGSQEELAASLEALTSNPAALRAAGKVASKMPPPDSLTGGTSGPASLPAGFGLLRRNRKEGRRRVTPGSLGDHGERFSLTVFSPWSRRPGRGEQGREEPPREQLFGSITPCPRVSGTMGRSPRGSSTPSHARRPGTEQADAVVPTRRERCLHPSFTGRDHTRGCQDQAEAHGQDPCAVLPDHRGRRPHQAGWPRDRGDRQVPPQERAVVHRG